MLDKNGFDLWADGYDAAVGLSDEENTYPFAGYKENLGRIFQTVMEKPGAAVLDVGFGTGTLTAKLYENGCAVYGQDFSPRMIELAAEKMHGAHLYQGDFSQGLAEPLTRQNYDFIVATYSLHHLTDAQKVRLLTDLLGRLNDGGKLLIGDVAFETRAEMRQCQQAAGDGWDDEEYYFVIDELRRAFPALRFEKTSYCAGVITITKPDRAKELLLQYNGNRFYMARNGDEHEYDGYHVSRETEERWRREYLDQFFEQKRYGKDALGAYATAAEFLKTTGSEADWERFLYYPIRSGWLDDVTVLFMLQRSFRSAESRAKKKSLPSETLDEYLRALREFIPLVQARADAGTLTRAEDYTMREFSDPVYVANYLKELQQDWTGLVRKGKK